MAFNGIIGKHKKDTFVASDKDIIVAIDFGTSRTGVVYGIRKSITIESLEVQPLEGAGVVYENDKKTLSAILLSRKPSNDPIAYGYSFFNYKTFLISILDIKQEQNIQMNNIKMIIFSDVLK